MTDPVQLFLEDRARAEGQEAWEAAATVLATVDPEGRPSARFVLVKQVDADGFWFYTNRESEKARHLAHTPRAALCFHWPTIGVQYRVEGPVEPSTDERSDAYFATRPRISQLGAWASAQSQPLPSREVLEARLREVEARFEGQDVPRPPHWGGYRVVPVRIERWVQGEHRLHDRFLYERSGSGWSMTRLSP